MTTEIKNILPPPKQNSSEKAVQQLRISSIWRKEHKPIQISQNNKTGH